MENFLETLFNFLWEHFLWLEKFEGLFLNDDSYLTRPNTGIVFTTILIAAMTIGMLFEYYENEKIKEQESFEMEAKLAEKRVNEEYWDFSEYPDYDPTISIENQ